MNTSKKGMAYKTLVQAAIIFSVGFIILISVLGPEGIWGGVADAATGFADNVFAKLPGKTFQKPIATTPQDMQDAAAKLWEALKNNNTKTCLVTYPKLPDDFNDYSIKLMQKKDEITIVLINPKGQTVDLGLVDIPEKELCVVAGDAAEAFYQKYATIGEIPKIKLYKNVDSIEIIDGDILFDGKKCDFENLGMLFHYDKKHTCFLPEDDTANTKSYGECGLDGSILNDIKQKTIPATIPECLSAELPPEKIDLCSQMKQCRDIYSKLECMEERDPDCKMLCYWDYQIFGDRCVDCNAIVQDGCIGYDKDICRANPCGFDPICYWDLDGGNNCQGCDKISECEAYDEQGCKTNPCKIASGCEWKEPWLWPNYCKAKGGT